MLTELDEENNINISKLYNEDQYKVLKSQSIKCFENILNSTSPITSKILVEAYNAFVIYNQTNKFKLIIEKALEQNVDLNAREYDSCNSTFLGRVCGVVDVNIIQFLLEKQANPNIPDINGIVPLHHTVWLPFIDKNDLNTLKLLAQEGSDINVKDLEGRSPIFFAACNGHIEAVKLLIQYGADFTDPIAGERLISEISLSMHEIRDLLILTIACQSNNFKTPKWVAPKNVQDFLDWQLSITPENSKFFSKHLSELYNLQNYLRDNTKLTNVESIQKLNDNIKLYSTLKYSLIFKIVDNPEIMENYKSYNKDFKYEDLQEGIRDELEKAGLKLSGEVTTKATDVTFE